jgi:hypothetical protein
MNKQGNINISRYGDMRPKTSAASVIVTATLIALIAMMGMITSTSEHGVNAQMMMGDRDGFGNMTSGLQEHQQKMVINGTIDLEQTNFEAISSKVNTSLIQAMTAAEQSVGNNSFALAAFGVDQGGYFVYTIFLSTPGMEFYNVIVDPGNGRILATEELSQEKLEERHQMHIAGIADNDVGSPFVH